jgi:transglutaminase-like putative cysteine protease
VSTWQDRVPSTWVVSLLAALTTWVTLLAWTSFAEYPAGFMGPLLFGCLLVAVTGMLLRSARVPALLVALAQAVMLLLWLQHRFVGGTTLAGLPTPDSVRAMTDVLREAGFAAQAYSSPVPRSVPEFYPLLIVTGSLTALMVDLLAVGLRRAPLAGLPLLAAYTAPVSILDGGVSWLKFAAAALCFLFLIAAEEAQRLSHWGHPLDSRTSDGPPPSAPVSQQAVWSSARKIGFTATTLALAVPLMIPTFSGTLFGGGNGNGDGEGDGVSVSNPMVDLKRDLTRGADIDLLTVRTTDPAPSYLRLTVLNRFDGGAWRPAGRDIPRSQRAEGTIADPPGLEAGVPTRKVTSTIDVSEFFTSRWLPTPYPASSVRAPGDWRYDRSTLDFISAADGQTTAGLSYRVQSLQVTPTAAQLADSAAAPLSLYTPNTDLPRDFPPAVRRLASNVTEGRATRFEQAVALQQWFREDGGFRYSLERSSGNGTDDLLTFLGTGRDSRVGYCEQFAAAMAVMGRTLGIPSRVAVGFLRPNDTGEDTWTYSTHDLHAWPEMYFGGVGWVRFEPTPQDRTGSALPPYTTQRLPSAAPSASSSGPSASPSASRVDKTTNGQTPTASTPAGAGVGAARIAAGAGVLVLVLLLVLAPRTLRALVRRRRRSAASGPADVVEAGWAEIRDTALDLGIAWDDRITLRRTAERLAQTFGDPADHDDALARGARRGPQAAPEAAAALHRVVELLERARYARSLSTTVTHEEMDADVAACVAAMRAGAGRRRRTRATWLPVSVFSSSSRRGRARRRGALLGGPGVDRAV